MARMLASSPQRSKDSLGLRCSSTDRDTAFVRSLLGAGSSNERRWWHTFSGIPAPLSLRHFRSLDRSSVLLIRLTLAHSALAAFCLANSTKTSTAAPVPAPNKVFSQLLRLIREFGVSSSGALLLPLQPFRLKPLRRSPSTDPFQPRHCSSAASAIATLQSPLRDRRPTDIILPQPAHGS